MKTILIIAIIIIAITPVSLARGQFPGEHPPIGFPPSNDTHILLLDNGTWKYDNNTSTFGELRAMNYTIYEDFTWRR